MMMTTVRMVQSTIAAMPTAREMKEKFRASREAISADTKSPRAKAVRTCTALKMAMMPVGQKQQMVVSTAMGM